MRYENVVQGRFLSRPNRFIALVELDGAETVCHVKNTGRCRELLVPGAEVYLVPGVTPGRRTPYDLVAVNKGGRLINMDAQEPNVCGVCTDLRPAGREHPAGVSLWRVAA